MVGKAFRARGKPALVRLKKFPEEHWASIGSVVSCAPLFLDEGTGCPWAFSCRPAKGQFCRKRSGRGYYGCRHYAF
jgi:hypothetical protein